MRSASTSFFRRNVVVRLPIVPRSVDPIVPDVISNPETRDSPAGALYPRPEFSHVRDDILGHFVVISLASYGGEYEARVDETAVRRRRARASSPLIFPSSLARLFAAPSSSRPSFLLRAPSLLFSSRRTAHYVVEALSLAHEHVAPPASWLILSRDIGRFGEIDGEPGRELIYIE